jgi:hypothetical protein
MENPSCRLYQADGKTYVFDSDGGFGGRWEAPGKMVFSHQFLEDPFEMVVEVMYSTDGKVEICHSENLVEVFHEVGNYPFY